MFYIVSNFENVDSGASIDFHRIIFLSQHIHDEIYIE